VSQMIVWINGAVMVMTSLGARSYSERALVGSSGQRRGEHVIREARPIVNAPRGRVAVEESSNSCSAMCST
jgi:hypothetical protein